MDLSKVDFSFGQWGHAIPRTHRHNSVQAHCDGNAADIIKFIYFIEHYEQMLNYSKQRKTYVRRTTNFLFRSLSFDSAEEHSHSSSNAAATGEGKADYIIPFSYWIEIPYDILTKVSLPRHTHTHVHTYYRTREHCLSFPGKWRWAGGARTRGRTRVIFFRGKWNEWESVYHVINGKFNKQNFNDTTQTLLSPHTLSPCLPSDKAFVCALWTYMK